MPIIKFKDVWEMYRIKFIIEGKASWEDFWALQGINFSMEKGELLGVIGENGSGKSTILRLVAGMLKPDRGKIEVLGSVSGLLELGAGFQTELTGRDNIFLQCELFGLLAGKAKEKLQEIIDFAEIGKFIDAPVKCYSQGMFVRLAFAIAVHMDSDIFLVDDTLSVGDEYFQKKCIKEIFKIKQRGKTVIIVTHDMAMLQKLCARTIFLKRGILFKDEETAKVVSFYSQTVGSPRGIAIIDQNPLSLIFNNGRLLLSWKDRMFTAFSGAYTTFSAANRWYSSTQAEWEIKEEAQGVFTAIGKFYQLGLTQVWRVEVSGKFEIKWDIELEMDKDVELSEMCANIAVKDEYSQWFSDSERGDFSAIKDEDKNCSPVFTKNGLSACIGVYQRVSGSSEIPSLLFEQISLGYSTQSSILNSDYLSHCRILQYRLNPYSNKSANQANRFICFAGKIAVNTADIDGYISKLQNEFILSTPDLRLIFDNGKCILDHKGISLTKGNHISTSIYVNGRWYFSDLARWNFKKQDSNRIIARGKWPNLPLTQIWEIEVNNDNSVKWDVSMQVDEELIIEQQYFFIVCSNGYSHWFSKYGSGTFPESFRETEMDMLQICLSDGELGVTGQDAKLPELRVRFSNQSHNYAKIINSNFYDKARIMRIDKVEPEKINKFSPGQYPCFKLGISLGGEKQAFDLSSNELSSKRLKFIFNQGSGRIFWDGKELTKRLGLYTSLCSRGRWYDSASSARWKIVEKNKNVIKIIGEWLYLPISQSWEVGIKEDNLIKFIVRMEINNEIEVDCLQTNLMLSEIYSQWIKEDQTNSFPVFNNNIDDKWDIIYSGRDGVKRIGVAKTIEHGLFLPTIILSTQEINAGQRLNVVNSDVYHRGRVLQSLDSTKRIIAAGDYLYFNGKITLGED
jgi:ABC-type polysaccharide/polyol phosphate transport system ATPase subunit